MYTAALQSPREHSERNVRRGLPSHKYLTRKLAPSPGNDCLPIPPSHSPAQNAPQTEYRRKERGLCWGFKKKERLALSQATPRVRKKREGPVLGVQ